MAKSNTPSFGAVQAPPARIRGGDVPLTVEEAQALVQAIADSPDGWASDGLTYDESRAAYSAANGYRRALQHHGLIPEGQTLGSRAQGDEGNVALYLRWREPRNKDKVTPQTNNADGSEKDKK